MSPESFQRKPKVERDFAAEAAAFVGQFNGVGSEFEQMIYAETKDKPNDQLRLAALFQSVYAVEQWFFRDRTSEVEAELCTLLKEFLAIPSVASKENKDKEIKIGKRINELMRSQKRNTEKFA